MVVRSPASLVAAAYVAVITLTLGTSAWSDTPRAGRPDARPAPADKSSPQVQHVSSAEQLALLDVSNAGQRRVEALMARLTPATDFATRLAIQREIVQAKLDTQVQWLVTHARFQRDQGSEAAALEAERYVEMLLHPKQTTPITAEQQRVQKAPNAGGGRQ